jgi:hypothetical protein
VRRLLIILVATGILAAGCGGGGGSTTSAAKPSGPPLTSAAYQAKLKAISADIAKSLGKSSTSGKIAKSEVDKLVTAFHTFADRLGQVNPPVEAKSLNARLIKAMNDLGNEFPGIADKLNKSGKDPGKAITALLGAHAIQELIKLGKDFKAKGYNLALNG